MINSEIKDRILGDLLETGTIHQISRGEQIAEIPWEYVELILDQFAAKGIATHNDVNKHGYTLKFTAYAYDFKNHGGFTAEEVVFNMNLDKLELELNKLQKTFPEKAQVFANALTGLSILSKFFHH